MRIGIDIDSITDTDQMKMRAVFHNEDSLVIGLSISGQTKEVLYYLEKAHEKKSKTILISSYYRDIYDRYCDEIILVPSLRHLNHGNVISPQFPLSVMVDILYAHLALEDKTKISKLHEDTLRALENEIEK